MSKVMPIVSAVILGVIVMVLPLLLVVPAYQDSQTQVSPTGGEELAMEPADLKEENEATEPYRESEALGPEMGTLILSNIAHVASIVAFGVLIALGVFLCAKKIIPFTGHLFRRRPNL